MRFIKHIQSRSRHAAGLLAVGGALAMAAPAGAFPHNPDFPHNPGDPASVATLCK